jgi:23S rRNA-intervening sequence protein
LNQYRVGFIILTLTEYVMANFKNFEQIEVWQKSRELTNLIIELLEGGFSKDFGLKEQIRKASVSIMSNIAEGFERSGTGEFSPIPGDSEGLRRRSAVPTIRSS